MKITLFDNDWTLIRGRNKAHLDSFDYAVKKIFGLDVSIREVAVEGRIDSQILLIMLESQGIHPDEAKVKIPKLFQEMVKYFRSHEDDGDYTPMPGAPELLKELKKRNTLIGVLTGNVEEIGWYKLEKAGLKQYIDFGAFGSEAYRRSDLVPIALEKAQKLQQNLTLQDLVLVGDSPLDVQCAKDAGVKIIAVAAADFSTEQLSKAEADLVVNSLQNQEEILNFLTS